MKLQFSRHISQKYSNTKFHANSSSGRRVVPCGRADRRPETWRDLTVAFRNSFIKTELISRRQTNTYNSEIKNSEVNESTNPEYIIKGLVKLAVEINSWEYEMCFSNRVSDGQFVNPDNTRILSQTTKRKSDYVRWVTATRFVQMQLWFILPYRITSHTGNINMGQRDLILLLRRHSSPYCCWSLWWISADGTFSPTRNLITTRCSTLRGTFCSLITLATPRQDWTGSNPSGREGGGCGFTLSRSHSCCAVRLVYTQISPGHIWTTLY